MNIIMNMPMLILLLFGFSIHALAQTPARDAAELANQGKYEEAVIKLEEAIRQNPKEAQLYLHLGLNYQALKRYDQALIALEEAIHLSPHLPQAHYSIALLYEALALDPSRVKQPVEPKIYWQKAKSAWQELLKSNAESSKKEIARKHLSKVNLEIEGKK